jgi:hypothetical protein
MVQSQYGGDDYNCHGVDYTNVRTNSDLLDVWGRRVKTYVREVA